MTSLVHDLSGLANVPLPGVRRSYVVPGKWDGMIQPGNIDLNSRPVVHNRDGSISTVKSVSFGIGGHEVLVPQVVGGRVVSPTEALAHYQRTGSHLGVFDTPEAANAYAVALHLSQAGRYTR